MQEIDKKLFECLKKSDVDGVKHALADGANPNAKNEQGITPLHMAVVLCGVDIVNLLIQYGADVNAKNVSGDTPLHKVFLRADVVRTLVENGADVNVQNAQGETPVYTATNENFRVQQQVVETLIELGADINLGDSMGDTPLHRAVYLDLIDAVQLYIMKGANVNACDNESKSTPLYLAQSGDVAHALIKNGADVNFRNVDGLSPLHWVRNPEVVELLIKNGADVNAYNESGTTPLWMAIRHASSATIKILRSHGAKSYIQAVRDIDTQLLQAVQFEDVATVKRLIKDGANVMTRGANEVTPLHVAGSAEIAQILIDNGADVMARTAAGMTPLHRAHNARVAEVLIANGAVVDAENKRGLTPLWIMMELAARHSELVRTLIQKGADVNKPSVSLVAPLHIAARFGNVDFAKMCIENGAAINPINANGRTPLDTAKVNNQEDLVVELLKHGAVENNEECEVDQPSIASLYALGRILVSAVKEYDAGNVGSLLELGADVNAREDYGVTALHWAAHHGWTALVERLIMQGAYINARDDDNETPLSYARTPAVRQLLIEHGAIE